MQQELVIDPSVLSAFADPARIFDLKSYNSNLLNKVLILDRNKHFDSLLLKKYKEIYDSLNSDAKCRVDTILYNHIKLTNKLKLIDCNISTDVFAEILPKTKSKIGNSEELNHKLLKMKNCEILNIAEFCDPPKTSRIINSPRLIQLRKNDEFRVFEILKDYFLDVQNMIIHDRFFLSHKSFKQYRLIIGQCPSLKSFSIYTSVLSIDDAYNRLRKTFPNILIDLIPVGTEYHDRKIILDSEIAMKFSNGLDFVNLSSIVWREEVTINIVKHTS